MSVQIALLKSGETIIADVKELIAEEKVCGYLFKNPHKLALTESMFLAEETEEDSVGVTFSPWIVFTNDTEIPVRPDWLVTIVDPAKEIRNLYEEKVNGTNSEVSFTEE